MTSTPVRPPRGAPAGHGLPLSSRRLGELLLSAGAIGLAAAFILTVERFRLLENPLYVPSCSINELLSCTSVMRSDQASVFGFPNSLLGIVGFTAVAVTGAALLAGARLARWYWRVLAAGLLAALVFVHWLAFQTLFRIGALCPYCLIVWAMVILTAWYTVLHLATRTSPRGRRMPAVQAWVTRNHLVVPTVWLLLIAAAVYAQLLAPWSG